MIEKIDKICPEEGQTNPGNPAPNRNLTIDTNPNSVE
jgi:hypothetical protein